MRKIIMLGMATVFSISLAAQKKGSYDDHKKGQVFILWGWNEDAFTKSNISFKGKDYDFKLYHVVAHDRPTPLGDLLKTLRWSKLTYPQTNFRIGYFLRENQTVTIGVDHMKYVMDKDQTVRMSGTITRNGPYKGNYDGPKVLSEDFMKFEHTDGLNYINVETEKYFTWLHAGKILNISGIIGGGMGILFPRTNVTMLGYERNDRYHVSGFGLSVKAGVQATFLKHIVFRFENKNGFIDMPNIILHKKGIPGRAKQAFFFTEFYGTFGATFSLAKSKHNK